MDPHHNEPRHLKRRLHCKFFYHLRRRTYQPSPHQQSGFTLVETLLVFMIFLIIVSVTAFHLKPQFQTVDERYFFTQFANDLYYAQLYAMTNQAQVSVSYSYDQSFYYFRISGGKELFRRYFADNIEITEGSLYGTFSFLPSGNVNKFGTLFVVIGEDKYKITTLLGKGRFYVVKRS